MFKGSLEDLQNLCSAPCHKMQQIPLADEDCGISAMCMLCKARKSRMPQMLEKPGSTATCWISVGLCVRFVLFKSCRKQFSPLSGGAEA